MSTEVRCDRCYALIRGGVPNKLILEWHIGDDMTISKDLCHDCMKKVDEFRVNFILSGKKAKP